MLDVCGGGLCKISSWAGTEYGLRRLFWHCISFDSTRYGYRNRSRSPLLSDFTKIMLNGFTSISLIDTGPIFKCSLISIDFKSRSLLNLNTKTWISVLIDCVNDARCSDEHLRYTKTEMKSYRTIDFAIDLSDHGICLHSDNALRIIDYQCFVRTIFFSYLANWLISIRLVNSIKNVCDVLLLAVSSSYMLKKIA